MPINGRKEKVTALKHHQPTITLTVQIDVSVPLALICAGEGDEIDSPRRVPLDSGFVKAACADILVLGLGMRESGPD